MHESFPIFIPALPKYFPHCGKQQNNTSKGTQITCSHLIHINLLLRRQHYSQATPKEVIKTHPATKQEVCTDMH